MGTNVTNVTHTVETNVTDTVGKIFYSHSGEDVETGRSFAGNWNHWSGNLKMMMMIMVMAMMTMMAMAIMI